MSLSDLNVCIVGCGAIGGLLSAHLINSGINVTLLDKGRQFDALSGRGLSLHDEAGLRWHHGNLNVFDNVGQCGKQDIVILAVKSHQIATLCPSIDQLFTPDTVVLTVQNGIPWWYFQNHRELQDRPLKSLDPDGVISDTIGADRIVGCVAFPAAEVISPGVIRHIEGNRFPLGELDGTQSSRARQISDLFTSAGLKAPILDDIRAEIWLKAWGNLAFNPISALTRSTMREIYLDAHTRGLVIALMNEAASVAARLGVSFRVPLEKRLDGAARVGEHRTSMLQDLDAGRELELEAILGSIIELARMTEVVTPNMDSVYTLARLLDKANRGA